LPTPWPEIIPRFAAQLREYRPAQIAIIASGRLTNEELFLLSEVRNLLGGADVLCDIVPRFGEADGILRSADLNPNSRGAELFGISKKGQHLGLIRQGIETGRIKALWVLHEDPPSPSSEIDWPAQLFEKLEMIAAQKILNNTVCAYAHYILPGASFAEKRGSMINAGGRLQRLNKAIPPPGQAMDDWQILVKLKDALGGGNGLHTIEDVFKAMAAATPALAGLSLSKIGDLGVDLKLEAAAK
jgi:NADH-quinone oxidoreductase subunit G